MRIGRDEVVEWLREGENYRNFFESEDVILIDEIYYRESDDIPIDFRSDRHHGKNR